MIDRIGDSETAAQPSLASFMRLLAHELGNPVATIRMSAEMIQSTVPPEMQAQLALMILEESKHLEELIERALFYASISEPTVVDIDVEQLLASIAQQFPSASISVVSPTASLQVKADPGQLGRMISESISNAVEAGASLITLSAAQANGHTVFVIDDDGEGIASVNTDRIFEPFYTMREGKLGLGLTIARRIAAMHSGSAEAAPGKSSGTSVSFRIPNNH